VESVARASGVDATRIGRIIEGEGVVALDAGGKRWFPTRGGYAHFA
jgi:thiamine-monophosphate kinase